jgi:gas vesicle protein
MSDESRRDEMAMHDEEHGGHPLALGLLAGTAVGVGLGLLIAPRKGSETRRQVGEHLSHAKEACATGLHRAKDTADDLAHRGRHAYDATRELVVNGAHETRRYVRDVADAVTMKSRRHHEDSSAKPSELHSKSNPAADAREQLRSAVAHSR